MMEQYAIPATCLPVAACGEVAGFASKLGVLPEAQAWEEPHGAIRADSRNVDGLCSGARGFHTEFLGHRWMDAPNVRIDVRSRASADAECEGGFPCLGRQTAASQGKITLPSVPNVILTTIVQRWLVGGPTLGAIK